MDWKTFFDITIPVVGALCLAVGACLYVKGKDDVKTFDAEIRFILWKIRNSPIELAYFKHIEREFERINKMPKKDREQIHVAWCEYARKFIKFFPDLGPEWDRKRKLRIQNNY